MTALFLRSLIHELPRTRDECDLQPTGMMAFLFDSSALTESSKVHQLEMAEA